MATKTLTGSYPSGYYLNPVYDILNTSAYVGGAGVTTTNMHPSTINNSGTVHGTTNGITLSDGGAIANTGIIGGTSPVDVSGGAGSVHNYSLLQSDPIVSANYSFYGINDGSFYTGPSIRMNNGGSVTNDAGCNIDNGISIVGGAGTVVNNGYVGGPELYRYRPVVAYGVFSFPFSIQLSQGTVTNGSESNTSAKIEHGVISYDYGQIDVLNFGTIDSASTDRPGGGPSLTYPVGDGIHAGLGTVVNGSETDRSATIQAFDFGILLSGRGSVVNNFGTIEAGSGFSAWYTDAIAVGVKVGNGSLTNGSETDRAALIKAETFGIWLLTSTATNFGTIESTYATAANTTPAGAFSRGSSGYQNSLTNGSTSDSAALISGHIGIDATFSTVVNFGTITGTGGTAISFHGTKLNKLVEEASGVLNGSVLGGGGILDLAGDAGAGSLTGLGSTISGFGTVTVDAGASWDLSGSSALANSQVLSNHGSLTITGALTNSGTIDLFANIINSGSIIDQASSKLLLEGDVSITTDPAVKAGAFSNAGTVQKVSGTGTSIIRTGTASFSSSGTITVSSGILELTGSTIAINGKITGAGTIEFSIGATTLGTGTSITTAGLMLAGTGTSVSVASNLGFAGNFSAGVNTELSIAAGALVQLTGPASFTRDTIDGAGRLTTKGTTTVSQSALGGTAQWYNSGTLSLTGGTLTVGDNAGNKAAFVNQATGIFDLAGNVNIGIGTGASIFTNQGQLAKTVGSLSTIGIGVANSGTVEAASGTLDLQKAVTGTGTLKIDAGKVLQADATVAGTQTVDFNGGSDRLVLTDAVHFAGKLQDFGTGDRLDLRQFNPSATTLAYSEKADNSGGTLVVTDGTLTAKIALLGQYAASGFHKASDGVGGTYVTYTPPAASSLAIPHS
jgi:hypothetical protein